MVDILGPKGAGGTHANACTEQSCQPKHAEVSGEPRAPVCSILQAKDTHVASKLQLLLPYQNGDHVPCGLLERKD
jgi:hypothetical protein